MKLYEIVRGGQTFVVQGDERMAKRFGAKLAKPKVAPVKKAAEKPKVEVAE